MPVAKISPCFFASARNLPGRETCRYGFGTEPRAAVSFLCFELGQTTHVLAGLVLVTEKLADEEQSLKQRLVADIWIKTDHASSAA